MPSLHVNRTVLALVCLTALGVGCEAAPKLWTEPDTEVQTNQVWLQLEAGLSKTTLRPTSTESTVDVYRFDQNQFAWRFEHTTSARSVASWQKDLNQPLAVANGVYFNEDYAPTGFLITDGKRISNRAFDPERSGLIILDPPVQLIDPRTERASEPLQNAAQSYPWLVRDGRATVTSDSGLSARRTFIATDVNGDIYLGIVPLGDMSLYQLSSLLAESSLGLDQALNLDGGPSSGIAISSQAGNEIENSFTAVPNVIVVTKK